MWQAATDGPGTGWDLHELRRYVKPSPQAVRELTSLIGPGTSRAH